MNVRIESVHKPRTYPISGQPFAGATLSVAGVKRAVGAPRLWEKTELIDNAGKKFAPQHFLKSQEHRDPAILSAFGTPTPQAGKFLLHYFSGWNSGSRQTPVLLVMGARRNANSWVDPTYDNRQIGMAPYLAAKGFKVFAITFPHPHGDNYCWAQNISDAIKRIRKVTGAEKVDLVAYSKGTVAARAYASGMKADGMDSFGNDVRRLVLLGGPNLGIDYTFRHPVYNLALWPEKADSDFDAPMSWNAIKIFGIPVNCEHLSLYTKAGNYFPGQAQMLSRLDSRHPLQMLEPDWYTTYYGGQGFFSSSKGIDEAIEEGGNFMEKLNNHPLDPSIQLAVIAGNKPDVPSYYNENTGASDGLVFVDSALHTDDMAKGGAAVIAKQLLPLNHLELHYDEKAKESVAEILSRQ